MTELAFKVPITILAGIFAGIVLFLASVLRRTSANLTASEYHAVFTGIIRYGRTSILINTTVLIPLLLLIAYLAIYGFEEMLFIAGALIYTAGSFVLSRLLNEPVYTQLLAVQRDDTEAISICRRKLNRANSARAIVSAAGVLLMGISLIV